MRKEEVPLVTLEQYSKSWSVHLTYVRSTRSSFSWSFEVRSLHILHNLAVYSTLLQKPTEEGLTLAYCLLINLAIVCSNLPP